MADESAHSELCCLELELTNEQHGAPASDEVDVGRGGTIDDELEGFRRRSDELGLVRRQLGQLAAARLVTDFDYVQAGRYRHLCQREGELLGLSRPWRAGRS